MRPLALVSAVVCAIACAASSEARTLASAAAFKNVRPRDAAAETFLRFGSEKSAEFRAIVRELESSNVIVYVDVREDGRQPVSGALNYLSEVGGIRWLRAVVHTGSASRSRTYTDIVRLTAILGHELRHALEASDADTLKDVGEFERYFRRIGVDEGPDLLDTEAARVTGTAVERELRGWSPPKAAPAALTAVRRQET